jgi:hypothetical protein
MGGTVPVIPAELSQMQREIYRAVFLDGRSHRKRTS